MVRTTVNLTEQQVAALRELAQREGVSVATLIRRAIEKFLAAPQISVDKP
jgi:predicted DNA-binding ribbon-helix-helix protein